MLTGRRREFLKELVRLSGRAQAAVHYTEIARALGVSKWSAYDMLRELARQGLARCIYHLDKAGPGRSQVRFVPTARGLEAVLGLSGRHQLSLSHLRERVGEGGYRHLLLGETGVGPLLFCGQLLAGLVRYIHELGDRSASFWRNLLARAEPAAGGLIMFAGGAGAVLAETGGDPEVSRRLPGLLSRFAQYVSEMGDEYRRLLHDLVQDLLADVARCECPSNSENPGRKEGVR